MAGETGVTGAGVTAPADPAGAMLPAAGAEPEAGTAIGFAGITSGPFWPQPDSISRTAAVLAAMPRNWLRRLVVDARCLLKIRGRVGIRVTMKSTIRIKLEIRLEIKTRITV